MGQMKPLSPAMALVVDDEPILRMMAIDLVEDAGFEALEAHDADSAMAILEAREDVAVLFTDIRMPGSIDGLELAHRVAIRWPSIEIILTSGHCRRADLGQIPGMFFAKPYDSQKITAKLAEIGQR